MTAASKDCPGFVLDKEKLRRFKDYTAYSKLQWLEEANVFLWKAMDKKTRAIWEKYRSGLI